MQQIAGLVIVATNDITIVVDILTSAGAVDTDVAREAHVDISIGECSLVCVNGLVECLESIVPSRTESYEQYGNILLGCSLLSSNFLVVDGVLRNDVVLLVVVVTTATCSKRGGYECKSYSSQDE